LEARIDFQPLVVCVLEYIEIRDVCCENVNVIRFVYYASTYVREALNLINFDLKGGSMSFQKAPRGVRFITQVVLPRKSRE